MLQLFMKDLKKGILTLIQIIYYYLMFYFDLASSPVPFQCLCPCPVSVSVSLSLVQCPVSSVLCLVSFVLCPVSLCRIPGLYYGERLLMSHLMFLQSEEQMLYSGNGKLILFAGTTALRFTPYFCGDHFHVVGRNCNNCMLNIFKA